METLLLFNFLGPEMLVIVFAILLLFGGKKIPELMRGIGSGIREFNAARSNIEQELKEGMREADRKEIEKRREGEEAK
ncbi:MAG: twin-arginine translocase TatA/TatE family subunit [Saprospiraceae bacterium]|nr:twin-arginine translocase TatA/TatE family subunit [Saprospiraceae bacterium]